VGEKCRIVEQTLKPGASVARVALAHGVNANQVQLAPAVSPGAAESEERRAGKLLPVHVSEEQVSKVNRLDRRQVAAAGTIEVEFPKGHVRRR
jgi:transposase